METKNASEYMNVIVRRRLIDMRFKAPMRFRAILAGFYENK